VKKRLTIPLISLGLITLALMGLWLARNQILINSFEKITDDKSNHRVHLTINSLDFSVSTMTVTTGNIFITFDSIYLDKSKSNSLTKLKFSGVLLQNFDVWTLLFHKQLEADKLVFFKPDVFVVTNKTGQATEVNPEKVIQSINSNSAYRFTFPAQLKKVEIRYGQIDVTDTSNPTIKFSTKNLTIFMEDFNSTQSGNNAARLNSLSKTLYIKAEKLYKSFQSKYALAVDSLWWVSEKNRFTAYGFSLLPTAEFADTAGMIEIEAGSLTASEFHLMGDTTQKATVEKLVLTNGRLHIREKKAMPSSTSTNQTDNLFFKLITVDTLTLNHNDLFMETNRGDTTLFFKDLNLNLRKLQLDSLFFRSPEQHFNYESFQFSTNSFVSNTLLQGLHLQSGKISYNSKRKKFVLDEFLTRDSIDDIHFHAGRIKFSLSLKKLLRKQKQTFDVFMIRPFIKMNVNPGQKTLQNDSSWIVQKLQPREIKISGGNFIAIYNKDADTLTLKNISLLAKKLQYNRANQKLTYDTLDFYAASLTYSNDKGFTFKAGITQINGNNLTINHSRFSGNSAHSWATLSRLRLKSFNLQKLVLNKELSADSLVLITPETHWSIRKSRTANSDTTFSLAKFVGDIEQKTPFKIDINHFTIKQGTVKVSFVDSASTASFGADYSLTWHQLQMGHATDHPFSSLKGVQLTMTDAYYTTSRFRTGIGNLTLKSDNGFLGFKNIRISNRANDTDSSFNIHELSVQFVGFRNLDYYNLLGKNRLVFSQLLLEGLTADIEKRDNLSSEPVPQIPKPLTINLKKLVQFETMFDTLQIKNTRLRYTLTGKSDTASYFIHNFNLEYIPLAKQNNITISELPLFNNSALRFDSVRVYNPLKGFSVEASYGEMNTYDSTFRLKELTLITSKERAHQSALKSGSILMTGMSTSDSLPIIFNARQLIIPKTDLKIVNLNPLDKVKKEQQSLKLSGLYKFSKLVNRFTIDTVLFSTINAVYYSGDSPKKQWSADRVKIKINGLAIDPPKALDTLPLQFNNLSADIYNRKFVTGDSLYEISARHFSYNHLNQSLAIDSFYVKPLFDTIAFFNKNRWQTDRINLFIPKVLFSKIKFNDWNKTNRLHISKIITEGMHADLYRDKAYPRDSLIRPLLIASLRKINQPFIVDTLLINNGYFRYSEKEKISDKPGYVYFSALNLKGINVTNITDNSTGTLTKIFTRGKLMGKGKVEANFYFPLSKSQSSQFWFSGKSEKLDLTTLNAMTQTNSGLTILSGKGTIDIPLITANDTVAIGSMMFKYRRLKVGLYNRKKANHSGGIATPLVGFVINGLVLRSNNPNWFKRPRVGIVYFNRDRNKSIANYIWKSTLSGALSTLGFNNKEQRKRRKEYRKEEFEVQRESVKNETYGN